MIFKLVHQLYDNAITVAEDLTGKPGLAVPQAEGGAGFDYRYAMGVSDYWIKLVKNTLDEHWSLLGGLWYELTNRRTDEKTIRYAESHDQALVGDQTLIFRLIGDRIYGHMSVMSEDLAVFRGVSLHKMIRLATLATAGHGYLNFMGNEFGHHIRMLPVMKKKMLVGIITDRDLKHASASDATSLEIHELLYLIGQIKVKDIMTSNPITVPCDCITRSNPNLIRKGDFSSSLRARVRIRLMPNKK